MRVDSDYSRKLSIRTCLYLKSILLIRGFLMSQITSSLARDILAAQAGHDIVVLLIEDIITLFDIFWEMRLIWHGSVNWRVSSSRRL